MWNAKTSTWDTVAVNMAGVPLGENSTGRRLTATLLDTDVVYLADDDGVPLTLTAATHDNVAVLCRKASSKGHMLCFVYLAEDGEPGRELLQKGHCMQFVDMAGFKKSDGINLTAASNKENKSLNFRCVCTRTHGTQN